MPQLYNWEEPDSFGEPNLEASLTSHEVAAALPIGLSQRLAFLADAEPSRALLGLAPISDAGISILEEHGILPPSSAARLIKELMNEAERDKDIRKAELIERALNDLGDDEDAQAFVWTDTGREVIVACRQRWAYLYPQQHT